MIGLGLNFWNCRGARGGGGGYEGPLDLVPGAVVAYSSARALSAANLGGSLYTVIREDDETSQTFSSDAVTGEAPIASITTFISGTTGLISTWFDQSGNNQDIPNTDTGSMPIWLAGEQNGKPGFTGDGKSLEATTFNGSVPSGEITIFVVGKRRFNVVGFNNATSFYECVVSTVNANITITDGTNIGNGSFDNTGTTINAYHVFEAKVAFGTRDFKVDGAALSLNSSDDAGGAVPSFTQNNFSVLLLGAGTKGVAEIMIYTSLLSDANRLAIRQNLATYYGITLA